MKVLSGRVVMAVLACAATAVMAASVASGSSSRGSTVKAHMAVKQLKVLWTYTGPKNDGGFNVSQEVAMNAMGTLPGVSVRGAYNLPYSQQATQLIEQAIATGTNVVSDTLGLTSLLTTACRRFPTQVYCFSPADPSPQPSNSISYWPADWNFGYAAGVAAGLMTKSDTVGFIAPAKIPIVVQAINTFAMGCKKVDPKCKVRVIFINNYYDPPADAQATNSLINAGADVLRNFVDDPSFCQIAARRGVYTVGDFNDFHPVCAKSNITSTFWVLSDFFKREARAIQAGNFHSSGSHPIIVPVTYAPGGPHLGPWGSFVPASVKHKVLNIYSQMVHGKNFIVGPISDQSGKLRFKAGQAVPPLYMLGTWNWFLPNVTTSG
jgi:basic membrane protein A